MEQQIHSKRENTLQKAETAALTLNWLPNNAINKGYTKSSIICFWWRCLHLYLLTPACWPHHCECSSMLSESCFLTFLVLIFFLSPSPAPLFSLLSGLEFPWGPKPFAEVVAGPLLRNNRQTTDSSSLEGHYVGVYFSAHWVSTQGAEEKRNKEDVDFCFALLASWVCQNTETWLRRKGIGSRAEQEDTERFMETDKRKKQEGGGDSIVFVCLRYQWLTLRVTLCTTTSGPLSQPASVTTPLWHHPYCLCLCWTCWYPGRSWLRDAWEVFFIICELLPDEMQAGLTQASQLCSCQSRSLRDRHCRPVTP